MIKSFEISEVTYDDGETVYFYNVDFFLVEEDEINEINDNDAFETICSMTSHAYKDKGLALIEGNNYVRAVEQDWANLQKRTGINYGYKQLV